MKQFLIILAALLLIASTNAQTGIGTTVPNASAQLEVNSTTKGFLPPRMSTIQRDAIVNPASGLQIYNTTSNTLEYKTTSGWVSLISNPNGVSIGEIQYWDGNAWISLAPPDTDGYVLKFVSNTPIWSPIGETYYRDADDDGYGDSSSFIIALSSPIGYVSNNLDCNDSDAVINPGTVWYTDADADGYGSSSSLLCERPANGFLLSELTGSGTDDCDDTNSAINPTTVWYIDTDGDGYGGSSTISCARPINGFLLPDLLGTGTDDCDDTDANVNIVTQTWFIDSDGDGYGVSSTVSCARPTNGFLLSELSGSGTDDCNDNNSLINPVTIWYADYDGDGYGNDAISEIGCSSMLTNATRNNSDCDDSDAAINPGTVWYSSSTRTYSAGCTLPGTGYALSGFYLHSNGVTCMCTDAAVGDLAAVNGVTYKKRIISEITSANAANTCTSGITDMSSLFNGDSTFNGNISSWDTSRVTTMNRMFKSASSFNQNIGFWDTTNVTNMASMFQLASVFNQDLSGWCVSYFSVQPSFFRSAANNWILPHPVWGKCSQ